VATCLPVGRDTWGIRERCGINDFNFDEWTKNITNPAP